mgnify:FL=1
MNRKDINAAIGLTEDEIGTIADAYESDEWDASHLGRVSPGRPSLYDEPMRSVTFKESEQVIAAMDSKARLLRMSRSNYIRSLIARDLALN